MIALNGISKPLIQVSPMPVGINKVRNNHLYTLNITKDSWPLFIVPGIGGKNDRFRMFGNIFRNVCTVYGIEMMGTQRNETPLNTIPAIAAQNIKWMKEVQPSGPYRLLGYSYGANILYEMVVQLEAAGDTLDFAAVLDQPIGELEGIQAGLSMTDLAMELLELCRDYYESFRIPFMQWDQALIYQLALLDLEDIVPAIARLMQQKVPHQSNSIEYVSRLVNVRLYNTNIVYRPSAKINTAIIVFNAKEVNKETEDDTLGWSAYADHVECVIVPGNHHSIVWGDNVLEVTKYLKNRIIHGR